MSSTWPWSWLAPDVHTCTVVGNRMEQPDDAERGLRHVRMSRDREAREGCLSDGLDTSEPVVPQGRVVCALAVCGRFHGHEHELKRYRVRLSACVVPHEPVSGLVGFGDRQSAWVSIHGRHGSRRRALPFIGSSALHQQRQMRMLGRDA